MSAMTREKILAAVREGRSLSGADLRRADLAGADLRRAVLFGADLRRADLAGADLAGADLFGADLAGANLYEADLFGADLFGADLAGADLFGANLRGANLRGADLIGANLRATRGGILTVDGLHPYRALLVPLTTGWRLTIECWSGTTDDLRTLIAKDDGWPEARGEQIAIRRPVLAALADLCDAHAAGHAADLAAVQERWGTA